MLLATFTMSALHRYFDTNQLKFLSSIYQSFTNFTIPILTISFLEILYISCRVNLG